MVDNSYDPYYGKLGCWVVDRRKSARFLDSESRGAKRGNKKVEQESSEQEAVKYKVQAQQGLNW